MHIGIQGEVPDQLACFWLRHLAVPGGNPRQDSQRPHQYASPLIRKGGPDSTAIWIWQATFLSNLLSAHRITMTCWLCPRVAVQVAEQHDFRRVVQELVVDVQHQHQERLIGIRTFGGPTGQEKSFFAQ